MHRFLTAKGGRPFAHIKPGFINTDLVRKGGLKRALPVILKFTQAVFRAASGIAHPTETVRKESADIINFMVIQTRQPCLQSRGVCPQSWTYPYPG